MMAKIGPSKKQRMAAAANVRSPFLYWMLVVTSWPPFGQVTVTGVSLKTTYKLEHSYKNSPTYYVEQLQTPTVAYMQLMQSNILYFL